MVTSAASAPSINALRPDALRFDIEGFEAFLQTRREPAWLIEQRREAWAAFERFEWPNRRGEEWARTDIRQFKLDGFRLPYGEAGPANGSVEGSLSVGLSLGGRTASLDGQTFVAELAEKWSKKGVLFGALDKLVETHGDLIRRHLFTRVLDPHYDKFAALHAACWTGGTLLYVPRGVSLDEPLHALAAMGPQGVDLGHLLVVLEDGAEATLLSETRSVLPAGADEASPGFHCGGIELVVGQGASLRFVSLQDWGPGAWHFAHQKAIVHQDGQLQWTIGALGARLAKVNQQVGLLGPGAHCQVNGAMFTEGKQHLAYHTLQHHEAPHCRSDFLYKAALQDKSRTVWRGLIKVDPGAIKTDGYQRNDNLMLSGHARADSIPGLEIEADDVRCTHGSTSGRVDEELIFYACCRGYTRQEAIRMIVTGFFQQIFDRITIDSVREALGRAIARRVREYE